MSALGHFGTGLYGKVTQIKTASDAHIAAATGAEHGAVSAATANMIMRRDASGRADIVAPAALDSSTKIPTTAWVQAEIVGSSGTVTSVSGGTGLTGTVTTSGSLNLANTSVAAGSYTAANFTVDAQGRLTAASNGSSVTSVGASAPITTSGGTTPSIGITAATGSVAGSMSATDKDKLDNIEASADVNDVTTVFGRVGAIVAVANDYDISEIDGITISDLGPSGGANGDMWFEY